VAATVVLLRAGGPAASAPGAGFEVYAIRRATTMVFGGVYAFPGGGVDPADGAAADNWAGRSPQWWARRLRLPAGSARAVVRAAARELYEESGVLLAGTTPDGLIRDLSHPRWEAARRALAAREHTLTEFLASEGLWLRSDLLVPWSRWITPEFEPRRFDTYFFLALLPGGQRARDVSGEADHAMWVRPADALAGYLAEELALLPPTAVTLRELAAFPDVPALLAAAAARDPGEPVRPRLEIEDGTARLLLDGLPG
jgi:8-oxo-dGTP pyrophosphatase MutT (NUDIX family)